MASTCRLDGCERPRETTRRYCPMHTPSPGEPNYRCTRETYLDVAPLVLVVERNGRPVSWTLTGTQRRMYYRAKKEGKINLDVAERILENFGRGIPETYGGYNGI